MAKNSISISEQPTVNLGLVGHVDHGKTTLTKLLSGTWTDTHSQEKKKGITIKLGYTNFSIFHDKKEDSYKVKNPENDSNLEFKQKFSIVDSPGHESFMATMISGAAVMDYAILLVAADEKCPQPQTIEHVRTLEIAGIEKVIVVQNKVDCVSREEAIENFHQIKQFLEGTKYVNSPIIPMSAEFGANLSLLLSKILEIFEVPERDTENPTPIMNIVRSFDVNKPGSSYKELRGGVLGGTIKHGKFKKGEEIEIRPGISNQKDGKITFTPIYTTINSLATDKTELNEAISGGSIAIATSLDPAVTKSDTLLGNIIGKKGTLPEPSETLSFDVHLLDKVITNNNEYEVKDIVKSEPLMLIVNSMTTVGFVTQANPKKVTVSLKRPVMAFDKERVVIFRMFEKQQWRIIGHGIINFS